MKPPLVVGNWKMHGAESEAIRLARQIRTGAKAIHGVEIVLAPPFTSLAAVHRLLRGSPLQLAAQDVYWEMEGAFTGEISPGMLMESGCRFVIIGHSERRRLFRESDQTVGRKMVAALQTGLRPILCVGESWQQRKRGETRRVIAGQLRAALKGLNKSAIEKVEIAYEPVWAIGTGRNATPDQVSEVHCWIRSCLKKLAANKAAQGCRILYGGSVRPENAGELSKAQEVGGLLVGGASLKPRDFLIIASYFVTQSL